MSKVSSTTCPNCGMKFMYEVLSTTSDGTNVWYRCKCGTEGHGWEQDEYVPADCIKLPDW